MLHAEEPVISTRVVPIERVHILIDTVTQIQAVTEQVRAERIELHHTVSDLLDRNQE